MNPPATAAGMDPVALYDALNCAAGALLLSEGEPDADRARKSQESLWEAFVAAADAFPAGSPEHEALHRVLESVSAFARNADPRLPAGAETGVAP